MADVTFSVGKNIRQAKGLKQITCSFDQFATAVLRPSGPNKDGLFVTGPLLNGERKTENAQPVSFLALDYDHLDKNSWKQVVLRSKSWSSFIYSTPSHNPVAGDYRLRVFVQLSRPVSNAEYRILYGMVAAELGVEADLAGAKIVQPIYTRREGTLASKNLTAEPLNVDTLLASNSEVDTLGPLPSWMKGKAVSTLAQEKVEHAPFWAADVANHCAQVRHVRDTQGHGALDHWRNVVGLVKIGQDGIELAREWTAKRLEAHDQANVDREWRTWKGTGPPLCETFERVNPAGCEGCPHKGKIKTPATLGRREPVGVVIEIAPMVFGKPVPLTLTFPNTFNFMAGCMVRVLKDKDGIEVSHRFCATKFWLTGRVGLINGDYGVQGIRELPDKRLKPFDLESGLIGGASTELFKALGKHEIMTTHNADSSKHMVAYLKDSLDKLQREAKEIEQLGSFGWKQDRTGFLLGNRMYNENGTVTTALVGGAALPLVRVFEQKETALASGWADGIDMLYNRDGMQHMQYALCSAFGSLLSPFAEALYKGIPCAITGESSGTGKTALAKAALYAFGDAERMTINGDRGATNNALYAQMSAFNNIPLLYDEVTNMDGKKLSDLLYTLSGGRDRGRLMQGRSGGTKAQEIGEWQSSMYMTANAKLTSTLAVGKGNTEAEAVRLFEISTDTYAVQLATIEEAAKAFEQIEENSGAAGDAYIRHLVANIEAVKLAFLRTATKIAATSGLHQVSQYRFFRQHVICTLTAAGIMKGLGIIKFDLEQLMGWAMKHLHLLCMDVRTNNVISSTDALGQMLTALSPFIIQTKELRDARTNKFGPEEVQKPNGPVVGRVVRETGTLYLSQAAVKRWCQENRQTPERIVEQATKDNNYLGDQKQFCLTRGTNLTAGRIPVYEFNWAMLDMDASE